MVKRLGRADVGEGFLEPDSARLPGSCSMSMPGDMAVPSSRDANLTSAAFNASPQPLFLPYGRPCVSHCECAQVRDRKVVRRLWWR